MRSKDNECDDSLIHDDSVQLNEENIYTDKINSDINNKCSSALVDNENKFNSKKQNQLEFEKLKEDYFAICDEKRSLELLLLDYQPYERKYKELIERFSTLQVNFDSIESKCERIQEENKNLHERVNKLSKDNIESVTLLNTLKESLKISEKERNQTNSKITFSNSKIKLLEKEIINLRKKTQNFNIQIKEFKEKLKDEMDEKILMEKEAADTKQEFENKIATLELEKQKLMKDSMMQLMNGINENNTIEFHYNNLSNKIEVIYENTKILEVENMHLEREREREKTLSKNNYNTYMNDKELSILHLNTEEDQTNSPLKKNKNFSIYNTEKGSLLGGSGYLKSKKGSHMALHKLFSKSRSSKRSYNCTDSENKENISMFGNFNGNKIVSLSNLESSKQKQYVTEYSKLDCNTFNTINNFHTIDNCIRKTNLNNVRYFLSSNNRHKKGLSLDEAMGQDRLDDNDNGLDHKDSIGETKKRIDFSTLEIVSQSNFIIDEVRNKSKEDVSTNHIHKKKTDADIYSVDKIGFKIEAWNLNITLNPKEKEYDSILLPYQ